MRVAYIKPEIGETYTLRNGGEYRCLWVSNTDKVKVMFGECSAVLIRDKDGWKRLSGSTKTRNTIPVGI